MLSKNNQKLQQQREAEQKQRFGLRKLSVGVASVLLGTTFYLGGVAHADVNENANATTPATTETVSAQPSATAENEVALNNATTPNESATDATASSTTPADKKATTTAPTTQPATTSNQDQAPATQGRELVAGQDFTVSDFKATDVKEDGGFTVQPNERIQLDLNFDNPDVASNNRIKIEFPGNLWAIDIPQSLANMNKELYWSGVHVGDLVNDNNGLAIQFREFSNLKDLKIELDLPMVNTDKTQLPYVKKLYTDKDEVYAKYEQGYTTKNDFVIGNQVFSTNHTIPVELAKGESKYTYRPAVVGKDYDYGTSSFSVGSIYRMPDGSVYFVKKSGPLYEGVSVKTAEQLVKDASQVSLSGTPGVAGYDIPSLYGLPGKFDAGKRVVLDDLRIPDESLYAQKDEKSNGEAQGTTTGDGATLKRIGNQPLESIKVWDNEKNKSITTANTFEVRYQLSAEKYDRMMQYIEDSLKKNPGKWTDDSVWYAVDDPNYSDLVLDINFNLKTDNNKEIPFTVKEPLHFTFDKIINATTAPQGGILVTAAVTGNVKYIDDTDHNKELANDNLGKGVVNQLINYTTADKIAEYEKQGYKLVSNNFEDGKTVYKYEKGNATINNYEVHLIHDTMPVHPGDNWPDNVKNKVNLTESATRTINYLDAKDHSIVVAPQVTQTVDFGRTAIVDKVTGEVLGFDTNGDGKVDQTDADKAWQVTSATKDWAEQVSPDLSKKGYQAPSIDKVEVETPTANTTDKTVDVYYDHATVPVHPGDEWPNNVADKDKVKLTESATRTINYLDAKDHSIVVAPQVTQTVDFGWTAIVDKVTGEVLGFDTNGDGQADVKVADGDQAWQVTSATKDWAEQVSPDLSKKGYQAPSIDKVEVETPTANTTDKTVDVYYDHDKVTITPNDPNPVNPGQPINPGYPEGPKFGPEVARDNLAKDAKQTVTYYTVDKDGNNKTEFNKVENPVKDAFTRTVTIDKVTGQVTETTPWTPDKKHFDAVATPKKDGYHADKKEAGQGDATPAQPNVVDKVVYKPNGHVIPVDPDGNPIPGNDQPPYPTDPTDPTKVVPNVPTPDVPGWTPDKPGDVPTPADPSKDTPVKYRQVVNGGIKYIDDTTGGVLETAEFGKGKVGDKVNYTTADKIKSYEDKGYELVSNNFKDGETVYNKTGNDYEVHFKHGLQPITPDKPGQPGQPINPNDPNSPKYGPETGRDQLVKDATQTVHYVDNKGNKVFDDKVQTAKDAFTKTLTIDKVTGKVVAETPFVGQHTFGKENTSVVEGYHADKKVAGGLTATVEQPNVEDTVTYAPNGHVIPVDPDGNVIPDAPTPTIPSDPNDPTKGQPNAPVPDVPGYTPVTPGKTVPVDPNKPGDDKYVPYVQVVNGHIKFIDDTTGKTLEEADFGQGKVGDKVNYTTADKIKAYEDKGYELVSNNFKDGETVYNKTGNDYEVHFEHGLQPITPDKPGQPGQPINPNNPDGPKYGPETGRDQLVKDATQTVHYVDKQGNKMGDDKVQTQKDAFTKTLTIDKVTGKVVAETPFVGQHTFGKETTPVVEGYHADKKVAGGLTATVEQPNVEDTVTYAKNGKVIPVDPDGNVIPDAPTPTYPTDPTDPTKVVPNVPVPNIPNWTPDTPTVPTPADPGEDTPVVYHPKTPVTPKDGTPTQPTDNTPTVPTTPAEPNQPAEVPAKTADNGDKTPAKPAPQAQLPQTGNDAKEAKATMALGMVGLTTAAAMLGFKKRRQG